MSPLALFNADLARTTELAQLRRKNTTVAEASADALADLFGDDFSRALYRETKWQVPDSDRLTCPVHHDWRSHCIDLHVQRPARPAAA